MPSEMRIDNRQSEGHECEFWKRSSLFRDRSERSRRFGKRVPFDLCASYRTNNRL